MPRFVRVTCGCAGPSATFLMRSDCFRSAIASMKLRCRLRTDGVGPLARSPRQAVCALDERAGILHCDIKTQNLAWDEKEGRVSLLDFGHAQEEERAVVVLGTRGLEAPEMVHKEPNTRATDRTPWARRCWTCWIRCSWRTGCCARSAIVWLSVTQSSA